MAWLWMLFLLFLPISLNAQVQKCADLAKTPPMGWNSWNRFHCDINETIIKEMADAMVTTGMKDVGYRYIIIDDCWQVGRDANGNIIPDPERFPSGMRALADYVHSRGLLFGLYTCAGTQTCQGRPGSRGYEFQDARQYAAWGVDYLKVDWCNTDGQSPVASYRLIRQALERAGRPMVLSICEWGVSKPWTWARGIGHLWRTTFDIADCWDCDDGHGNHLGWTKILDQQIGLEAYAGPGHWNDPDMLEVGNGGMSIEEYKAHFSLWCILAAPLITGNDLRNMQEAIKDILTNKEVIAVDQDSLGLQGRKVQDNGDLEVWAKQLADGSRAVALLNRGSQTARIAVRWVEIGYPAHLKAKVRDLWAHKNLGKFRGKFSTEVPSHSVGLVLISP